MTPPNPTPADLVARYADLVRALNALALPIEDGDDPWTAESYQVAISDASDAIAALQAEQERLKAQTCETCQFSFVGMAPAGCPHHRMCKRTKEDTGQGSFWFAKCEALGNGCRAWSPREEGTR